MNTPIETPNTNLDPLEKTEWRESFVALAAQASTLHARFMVARAHKAYDELGGHIGSIADAAKGCA